jgi:hypothetical protein
MATLQFTEEQARRLEAIYSTAVVLTRESV